MGSSLNTEHVPTQAKQCEGSQKLFTGRSSVVSWASMGSPITKEQMDSETVTDIETLSDDSDTQGLGVMGAVIAEERINHESYSSVRSLQPLEVEECLQRLSGYVLKYPINGGWWFAQAKERFISVVVPKEWHPEGNRWLQARSARLEEPSLCYWDYEELSVCSEPNGSIPIADVSEVICDAQGDAGSLVKIRAASKCKFSNTTKARFVKVGDFMLTLRFADGIEAKSWANDFKAFVRWSQAEQRRSSVKGSA